VHPLDTGLLRAASYNDHVFKVTVRYWSDINTDSAREESPKVKPEGYARDIDLNYTREPESTLNRASNSSVLWPITPKASCRVFPR
jgi:hypothetical protein